MNHQWGNVVEPRDKKPEVKVSFNRGDKVAIQMVARWFGLSIKDFEKIIPGKGEGNAS